MLSFEPTQAGKESLLLGTSGIVSYKVAVKGLAAHAGANPELGVNALVEAADIVLRTMDLDDKARHLRFNWTVSKSGDVPNIVPAAANLEANIRYARSEDLDALLATLEQRIQGKKKLPKAEITPRGDFLVDGKAVAVDARQRQALLAYRDGARIHAGVAHGALTPREAARLGARQAHIRHIEHHYRADGHLGPRERADLQRRLDRSSAAIRRQAHDRQRW